MQKNITQNFITKKDQLDHIAKAVRRKRINKKMTQTDLAKAVGVSAQYISNIETYRTGAINLETLSKIARALKSERRDLIGRPPRHQEHDHDNNGTCDPNLLPLDKRFYQLSPLLPTEPTSKIVTMSNILLGIFILAIILRIITL
jgi:transcriptional regulator with XRE-family HTH domain